MRNRKRWHDKNRKGGQVDIGPFLGWVEQYAATRRAQEGPNAKKGLPAFGEDQLAFELGVSARTIWRWRNEAQYVQLDTVDRVCVHLGTPWLLEELYPLDPMALVA